MSHLNEKRGELKEVMDKLQNLNDDYRSKVNKKQVRANCKHQTIYQVRQAWIFSHYCFILLRSTLGEIVLSESLLS